jgi:hypothetical protein
MTRPDEKACEVPLSNGGAALIDEADLELVAGYRWNGKASVRTRYAQASCQDNGGWIVVLMHRLITGAPEGVEVDHVNGDGLDNRRSNLRLATRLQNGANRRKRNGTTSSRFKGVYLITPAGTWQAHITVCGKHLTRGRYRTEEEAALAYDAAAKEHFGDYAALNFPGYAGPHPTRTPIGGEPKLSPEQVVRAKAEYDRGGVIWRDLARRYGVGERTLRRAVKNLERIPTVFGEAS